MTARPVPFQALVLAKAPVPGRVKTRLCPPCTPAQAAELAHASLLDTLDAVRGSAARRRLLVLDAPRFAAGLPHAGFGVVPQRPGPLGARLAAAFADTAHPGLASVLVGMDTPQVDADRLDAVVAGLADADAVLGPATDGGWWVLALRDARHAEVLAAVATSTPTTGADTRAALRSAGLRVADAAPATDVDTAESAREVAALAPDTRFAGAWTRMAESLTALETA
ncbi:DUF2064 domain-containing protein [Cryptosporangium sp. NPDC051539]|uniref:TIGR04282 family arsenosugar biosynthesis glycosyltransferase n=1 Tax=Cryptosporangium sp. NPDC051539 TaxID=3363962 RepID=UPI0037A90170